MGSSRESWEESEPECRVGAKEGIKTERKMEEGKKERKEKVRRDREEKEEREEERGTEGEKKGGTEGAKSYPVRLGDNRSSLGVFSEKLPREMGPS